MLCVLRVNPTRDAKDLSGDRPLVNETTFRVSRFSLSIRAAYDNGTDQPQVGRGELQRRGTRFSLWTIVGAPVLAEFWRLGLILVAFVPPLPADAHDVHASN